MTKPQMIALIVLIVILSIGVIFLVDNESTQEDSGVAETSGQFDENRAAILADELRSLDPVVLEVQQALAELIIDIKPVDEADPLSSMFIEFVPGIKVSETGRVSGNSRGVNASTTFLRSLLPDIDGYSAGCTGLSNDRVQALESFPENATSIEEFQTIELQKDLIALYKDESVQKELVSELKGGEEAQEALDGLIKLLEAGDYHPLSVIEICNTQDTYQVAVSTDVPFFGTQPDPVVLIWNGSKYEQHVMTFGLGAETYYEFLPSTDIYNSLIFISDQLPLAGVEVWVFHELGEDGFKIVETCAGYIKEGDSSLGDQDQTFVYGCQQEFSEK